MLELRWSGPSLSSQVLFRIEGEVRGGLHLPDAILWGEVASATPLRGWHEVAAKKAHQFHKV